MTNKEQFTEMVGNNPKLLQCFKTATKDRDGYLHSRDWAKTKPSGTTSPANGIANPVKLRLKKDGAPFAKKEPE